MRVLWIATKSPLPAIDGGRLLASKTLEGLRDSGCQLTMLVPVDPYREEAAQLRASLEPLGRVILVPRRLPGRARSVVRALATGLPITLARHGSPDVSASVARALNDEAFDVVHAEQLQAFAAAAPATARRIPVVLRCQNVETDLWASALGQGGLRRLLRGREVSRLGAAEAAAVRAAAATIALCNEDAARLGELADSGRSVHVVAPPFPAELPAGAPLAGNPALTLLGSAGWEPNREGLAWFAERVWPTVCARLPGATLHVFGMRWPARVARTSGGCGGVVEHPAPVESASAFGAGSMLVVPLHTGSGVRMKILEAWARGIPVVATSAAARGLGAGADGAVSLADDPCAFAGAIRELAEAPLRAAARIRAGRRMLVDHHHPARVVDELRAIYGSCAARSAGRLGG